MNDPLTLRLETQADRERFAAMLAQVDRNIDKSEHEAKEQHLLTQSRAIRNHRAADHLVVYAKNTGDNQ